MTYSINKDEIKRIADELGIEVKFDTETPGVLNLQTGERRPLSSYFEEIFVEKSLYMYQEESDVLKLKQRTEKISAKRIGKSKAMETEFDLEYQIA